MGFLDETSHHLGGIIVSVRRKMGCIVTTYQQRSQLCASSYLQVGSNPVAMFPICGYQSTGRVLVGYSSSRACHESGPTYSEDVDDGMRDAREY